MLEVVKQDAKELEDAAAEFLPDREIVLEVAKQDEQTLVYAATEPLPDRERVAELVLGEVGSLGEHLAMPGVAWLPPGWRGLTRL